ncbi:WD40-repeat-containing domain protein [Scleroderma yunnanense]
MRFSLAKLVAKRLAPSEDDPGSSTSHTDAPTTVITHSLRHLINEVDSTHHAILDARETHSHIKHVPNVADTITGGYTTSNNVINQINSFNAAYLQPLQKFQSVVQSISNTHPYAKLALGVLDIAAQLILRQVEIDKSVAGLLDKINQVYEFMLQDKMLAKIGSTKDTLLQIAQAVQESTQFIVNYSKTKHFWARLGKNIFSETRGVVTRYSDTLDGLMQQFRERAIRSIHINIHQIAEDSILQGIAYADGAGLNTTKTCLEGTRIQILNEIVDWVESCGPEVPRIFWLHGNAGKGKSAIAHTISVQYENMGRLGSCFCFSRARHAERRHEKLFTTISRDLADRDVGLRQALAETLTSNQRLKGTCDVTQQWEKLILGPLSKWMGPLLGNVLVVIDALDESGEERSREHILRVLASSHVMDLPTNFRILLISRPLPDIHDALCNVKHVMSRSLDDIPASSTEDDIHLYISDRLGNVGKGFHPQDIAQLAQKSDGLFEWARLACEFISKRKPGTTPSGRFREIMSYAPGRGGRTLLDEMYTAILRDTIGNTPETLVHFRSIMRQILGVQEPLTIDSLNTLCYSGTHTGVNRMGVETILDFMASLLSGITDRSTPVRPLHTSFHDYLIDPGRSGEFYVDTLGIHAELSFACLCVMHDLSFNICGLESSYVLNADIKDLDKRVQRNIPLHLSYACRFWASHLEKAAFESSLAMEVVHFLISPKILFWMEALTLLKALGNASGALVAATDWLEGKDGCHEAVLMARDAIKFIRTFGVAIMQSTPHLYLSALPFSPSNSALFQHLSLTFPKVARVIDGHQMNWPTMQLLLKGHTGWVTSASFSPDGRHIISGSQDCTICVWDADTGLQRGDPIKGHTDWIRSVGVSPDGKKIVSGGVDGTVHVWDMKTGLPLGDSFGGHVRAVTSVAFSPDGKWLASSSDDHTICLQSIGGTTILRGHFDAVTSFAFSPDGKKIVSGSSDCTIQLWDTEKGKPIGGQLRGHTQPVTSVAYSPHGRWIVSGSDDCTVCVWDAKEGLQKGITLKGHVKRVKSVAFSPNGKWIVSGSADHTLQVWDVETGMQVGNPLKGHTGPVRSVAFSGDGKWIVSGSYDTTLCVWDLEKVLQVESYVNGHSRGITSVAISLDSKWIVSGSYDCTVQLWDAENGLQMGSGLQGHTEPVTSVAVSPDGKWIVSGSNDGTICLWDVVQREKRNAPLKGHSRGVTSVSFSSDGRYIASGSKDGTICLWDVKMSQVTMEKSLEEHTDWITSVAFSPDGKWIVTGSCNHTIHVWDVERGCQKVGPLSGHKGSVYSVVFSPDGKWVASGSSDTTICMWDVAKGMKVEKVLKGHIKGVTSVVFSLDNKWIISGSADCTIRVWDIIQGLQVGIALEGHSGPITSITLPTHGKWVVSGSEDCTIRIWDISGEDDISKPHICFSSMASHKLNDVQGFYGNIHKFTRLHKDGWIVGESSQLLLWIPPASRKSFYSPQNILVIPRGGIQLDLSKMAHGSMWHQCILHST